MWQRVKKCTLMVFSSRVSVVGLLPSACELLTLSFQLRNVELKGRIKAKIKGRSSHQLLLLNAGDGFAVKFPLQAGY